MTRFAPFDRRGFLRAAIAGLGGCVVGCGESNPGTSRDGATPRLLPEGAALRTLAVLPNESGDTGSFVATLTAAPAQASPLPGASTTMLLYNGVGPGPLIELREGQRVRITLDNRMSQESTIHWHGLPVPPDQDGNPMDPVPAGAQRLYEFDMPAGSAGTYWYHPHPHDITAAQVAFGLAGPIVVRADDDPLAHLPEAHLFISGLRLDADARVPPDTPLDWTIGRQNEKLLVNGGRLPVRALRPGTTERWRVFNATNARHFRLALDGHSFTLVGTDGGLLAAPVAGLTEITLAPAQRVELVVTANGSPNGRYRLRALAYQADYLGLGSYADEDLMTIVTTNELPAAPVELPRTLRPIADLGTPQLRQLVEFTEVSDLCTRTGATHAFLINGHVFDLNRVDLTTVAGRVELWDIVNHTGMSHPFHIHGTQFQLVSRTLGTQTTPAPYLAWIDTVLVPSQHTATIKVRQTQAGRRMFHCHILEHEDNCMMAILDVQAAGSG